jgi:Dyp-type peroxidase family
MSEGDIELREANVQGIGLAGFRKDHQELLFVRFADARRGRRLLGHLAPNVATHEEVAAFNRLFSEIRRRRGEDGTVQATWLGLALSAEGLRMLGADLGGLGEGEGSAAFAERMASRAEEIGDTRPADQPSAWEREFRPEAPPIQALLVLAADSGDDLADRVAWARERIEDADCEVVFSERGHTLPGRMAGHEHFGFKDGVSQPAVADIDPPPAEGEPPAIALGEFVLGYPDQNGQVAPASDTFKDGSFLVFRRLRQDVFGFRRQAAATLPEASPVPTQAQLAAKMVGRWPSGAPTETSPDEDPGNDGVTNAFAYGADTDGERTPRFAHVRKVNPRDEVRPSAEGEPVERRRMIRRGIPFGEPLPPEATEDDGRKRGLHFISIVSDVVRQFEFIQRQWASDPNFPSGGAPATEGGPYSPPSGGEPSDGPDPIIGQHDDEGVEDALHQESGVRRFPLGPEVVNVTAGEYFFCPSIAAIDALATGD